ncbi:MAG: cell division ATP-binding protein FtsE, partial [Candidatus Saccharicenans sp.]
SLGIMQLLRAINASGTTVVMATHEATFVDIMQQRVVELSQGVVVRDEQSGGYGETASIPLADLTAAGAQVLRASEDVVRQTLAPEPGPETEGAEALDAVPAPSAQPTATIPDSSAEAAPTMVKPVSTAPAQPAEALALPETHDDLDRTVRATRAPGSRIPAFLEPGEDMDPVRLAERGSLAERLGLNARDDDDQTDVGPVR